MSVYETIKQAVQNRRVISATYDGYYREFCPHVVGTKNGVQMVLCLQSGGQSSKGLDADPAKNWRCVLVSKLADVTLVLGEWTTAPNHSRPQSCVDTIDAEVSF